MVSFAMAHVSVAYASKKATSMQVVIMADIGRHLPNPVVRSARRWSGIVRPRSLIHVSREAAEFKLRCIEFSSSPCERSPDMKLTPIACPSCGSPVHIESGQILTECPFCGQQLHVDDGSRHVEHTVVYDGSEDAGYLFEKGRMQAQRDAEWLKRFGDSSEGLSDRQGLNEPDDVATTIPAPKPKAVTLRGLVVVLVCLATFAGLLLWLPSLLSHSQRLGTSVVTRVRTGPEMLSSFAHIGYDEVSNPEEWDYLVTAEDFYEYGTDSDYCVSQGRYVIANLTDEQTPEFKVIQDTNDGSNDAVTVGFVHLAPHEQIRATLPDDSETMLIPYKAGLWIGIRDIEDADDGNDYYEVDEGGEGA